MFAGLDGSAKDAEFVWIAAVWSVISLILFKRSPWSPRSIKRIYFKQIAHILSLFKYFVYPEIPKQRSGAT
jgi:hypothetical protein